MGCQLIVNGTFFLERKAFMEENIEKKDISGDYLNF